MRTEPDEDLRFPLLELDDAEFEDYVRDGHADIPIGEVTFFLPEFAVD